MRVRYVAAAGAIVLAGLVVIGFALVWHPAIEPVTPAPRTAFPHDVVARGRQLASLGFCASCHTAEGGKPLAGGRALATPFGTIYGTNITPDLDSGIGRWSLEAFNRAMRRGIDRGGHHLYPAFPYSHFTKLTDGDIEAIYDYLMTREPVRADNHPNDLRFPFNIRALMAGWNLLFLRPGPYENDDSKSEAWNHGAYLAEGLSHCGACHTPRNGLGAEEAGKGFSGGEAEGWWAPSLNQDAVAPVRWTEESLFNALRSWDVDHGGAAGPMQPVVASLGEVPEADVRAIATYVASLTRHPDEARTQAIERIAAGDRKAAADTANPAGASVYAGACAQCHDSGGQVPFTLRSLALHSSLWAPDPRDVVNAVRNGIQPSFARAGGIMPPFAASLTDRQIADVAAYVRARFTDRPAWTGLDASAATPKGPS